MVHAFGKLRTSQIPLMCFFLLLVFLQLFLFSQVPEIIIQEERSVEQIKVSCCKKASNLKAKMGVSPGRSVMRWDSCSEGCGFKSQHRIQPGHFSQKNVFLVKKMIYLFKRRKSMKKRTGMAIFLKKYLTHDFNVSKTKDLIKSLIKWAISSRGSVWPHLAKLRDLAKLWKYLAVLFRFILRFGKSLNALWQICQAFGQIFNVVNGQIFKNNLAIRSHWRGVSLVCLMFTLLSQ